MMIKLYLSIQFKINAWFAPNFIQNSELQPLQTILQLIQQYNIDRSAISTAISTLSVAIQNISSSSSSIYHSLFFEQQVNIYIKFIIYLFIYSKFYFFVCSFIYSKIYFFV